MAILRLQKSHRPSYLIVRSLRFGKQLCDLIASEFGSVIVSSCHRQLPRQESPSPGATIVLRTQAAISRSNRSDVSSREAELIGFVKRKSNARVSIFFGKMPFFIR